MAHKKQDIEHSVSHLSMNDLEQERKQIDSHLLVLEEKLDTLK